MLSSRNVDKRKEGDWLLCLHLQFMNGAFTVVWPQRRESSVSTEKEEGRSLLGPGPPCPCCPLC